MKEIGSLGRWFLVCVVTLVALVALLGANMGTIPAAPFGMVASSDECDSIYNPSQSHTDSAGQGDICGCDKYAATDGSDENSGTQTNPFRSPQKLSDSLAPGQVGCLRGGAYTAPDGNWQLTHGGAADARITLRGYPGESVKFVGRVHIPDGVDYVTVRNMMLDGSRAPRNEDGYTLPSPTIQGDYVQLLNNDITNQHNGICISLGNIYYGLAVAPLIQNNRIYDCGWLPRTNRHHGIYAGYVRDAKILNNIIYNNADFGVKMGPDADRTLVAQNVIDRNGVGVSFSGEGDQVSEYNEVKYNILTNSQNRWNVQGFWPEGLIGQGNIVHANCLRATNPRDDYYNQNGGVHPKAGGFDAYDNSIANPTC